MQSSCLTGDMFFVTWLTCGPGFFAGKFLPYKEQRVADNVATLKQ